MIIGTRKVSFNLKPTYFKLTVIRCYIPHEYALVVFAFDAVFSHL